MSVCLQNEIGTKLEQNKMNQTNAIASTSTLVLVFVLNSKGNSGNRVMLPVCCAPYTSRWSAYTINRVSLDDIQPTKVSFAFKQKCRKLRLI